MKLCIRSFAIGNTVTRRGTELPVNDARVLACPSAFIDVEVEAPVEAPVERATAKPGEKRTTRRARKDS